LEQLGMSQRDLRKERGGDGETGDRKPPCPYQE
jgi:hypothetical protein